MPRKKKTAKMVLHAAPDRLRRTWTIKPASRVSENRRREKLEKIRERESRGDG